MSKWTGLMRRITAEDAEDEPEHERLFSRPPRRPSSETLALLDRAEAQKRLFSKRESAYEGTHQKTAKSMPKSTPLTLPGAVRVQFNTCGKSSCRCACGELHGPYFRRQWYVGNRLRSAYVRRKDVDAIRAACRRWQAEQAERRIALQQGRVSFRALLAELRRFRC